MAGRNQIRAGKAYVEIALKDKVRGGLRRVAARLRAFGSTVGAIGAGLAGAGTAIAGPWAWARGGGGGGRRRCIRKARACAMPSCCIRPQALPVAMCSISTSNSVPTRMPC